jgi:hypothetical protein
MFTAPMRRRWSLDVLLASSTLAALFIALSPHPARSDAFRVVAGTIAVNSTWHRGHTYRLAGPVRVSDGATLVIEPGVRIEGEMGAALVVDRTSRIQAIGTLLEPIVFACARETIATRDCWGGLIVAGNAPVNGGVSNSPPARGTGASGCAQRTDDALAGSYGGCDAFDNSGTLRYVRVESGVRGLQLLAVGSQTVLDFVQVHNGGTGGVTVRGGTVDLRHVIVTSTSVAGLRWSNGWTGRAQHVLVQFPADGGVGIDGSNDATSPSAVPVANPRLYNVSIVRQVSAGAQSPATGIRLWGGTGVHIGNLLIGGFDVVLDIDGRGGCSPSGVAPLIELRHGIVASVASFGDPDIDDASCPTGSTLEDAYLADASLARVTDAVLIAQLMKDGFHPTLPDFRTLSTLFLSQATVPPSDGFFTPSAYVGASESATTRDADISWTTGWTTHVVAAAVPLLGSVSGVVSSATRGALNGVRVEVDGNSAYTTPTGAYAIAGIVAGVHAAVVTTAPPGCTTPTSTTATILAGATATADIAVACTPPTIELSKLRLTYICGQRFRVRNSNDAVVPVTWDVAGTTETGSLLLPGRPVDANFSETFFVTANVGTVRLFYNGAQADVKANGGFPCES